VLPLLLLLLLLLPLQVRSLLVVYKVVQLLLVMLAPQVKGVAILDCMQFSRT
jgi:hypothetical protein